VNHRERLLLLYLARQQRRQPVRRPTYWLIRLALAFLLGLTLFVGFMVATGAGGVLAVYAYFTKDLPDPEEMDRRAATFRSTKIYDRKGQLLYEVFDPQGGRRTWVPLSQIPRHVIEATIATEDRDFYTNPGFDFRRFVRAGIATLFEGRREGASTITQQLVKIVLLTPEISYERKIKEALLSLEITRRYSKDQILEMYLNEIPYGNLSYGIEAAAMSYFGKHAQDLTVAEGTFLAGLPQSPGIYDPYVNPQAAKARHRDVLDLMVREGYLSAAEANTIYNMRLVVTFSNEQLIKARAEAGQSGEQALIIVPQRVEIKAPHFVFYVRNLLEKKYGVDRVQRGGLSVYTTLDLDLQRIAEAAAQQQIAKLWERNARNAALVAIRPNTGEILAMVGSVDYFDTEIKGQVNVAISERQPGSAFKPFAYVTAFAKGWTAATMVMDVRTSFDDGPMNPPYIPENVDGKWRGPLRLRQALALSENVPAVKVTEFATVRGVLDMAHRMGITTLNDPSRYGLSICLGGGEVTLLDLVYAYTVFANGGIMAGQPRPPEELRPGYRELDPVAILRVTDSDGTILEEYRQPQTRDVLTPQLAYLITSILSDNQARYEIIGDALSLSRPAAAKTGTTTDWKDNWTIGYTPELAAGVWVGNTDAQEMRRSFGSTAAAPIWKQFLETVYKNVDEYKAIKPHPFDEPPGLERQEVCAISGLKPTEHCQDRVTEIFIKGTAPTREDDIFQVFKIDRANGKLATQYTPPQDIEEKVFPIFPPEAADWVRESNIPQPPTEYSERGDPNVSGGDVAIQSPRAYSSVAGRIPIKGNARSQRFRAYRLEFGQGLQPSQWIPIGSEHGHQVSDGVLETWDTTGYDGLYTLQLSVMERDGNTRRAIIPVTIDNISPTVKVVYPITKEVFIYEAIKENKVRIQAEAKDNNAMERVEFYLDGELLGVSRVAPFNVLWPMVMTTAVTSAMPVTETHEIYAIAFDLAGNQQKSDPIIFQVATPPPKTQSSFLDGWVWATRDRRLVGRIELL